MHAPRRPFRAAATLLAILLGCAPAAAAAPDAPRLSVGRPDGFDALLQPQVALVDVHVGGRAVGQTRVRYTPGRVMLLDVDALVALLPDLLDPAAVRAALAVPDLDAHPAFLCRGESEAERADCPIYTPGVAGIVFDPDRFRLDVLVAPRLLAVHAAQPRAYLSPPGAGVSLVDQVGGSIAGSGRRLSYGFQNRAILAWGAARLRSELSLSSTYGLSVDTLAAEVDRPGVRYAAGALWTPGIDLTGRRRLVGVAVQSQTDTRLDRAVIAGTPLAVSLAQRARVDILRDGRLLTSRTYDPGNRMLDTATLPDGAYDVVLHIQEAGGAARDERRFFTRNAAIANIGEPIVFASLGLLGADRRSTPLAVTGIPLYQAGIAKRMGPHLALDAVLMGTNRTALVELGGYWLTHAAQLRLAALGTVRGEVGLLAQASSSGLSRIGYTLDARRVWSRRRAPLIPLGVARDRWDGATIDRIAEAAAGSYTQANATIGFDLKPGRIGVAASYRSGAHEGRSYAVGPSLYLPVAERGGVRVDLRADLTQSNHGRGAFVGLSLQRIGGGGSLSANAGLRSTGGGGGGGGGGGTAAVGGIAGSWQRGGVLGGDASLSAGVEREVGGTLARARGELNTDVAALYADVAQPIGGRGTTQYGFEFQTTVAAGAGGLALRGRERHDSAVRVEVVDAPADASFEVLVDNAPRGVVRAGRPRSIALPPYRQYGVRLRPLGTAIVRIDGGTRQVSAYPGTVGRLSWSARPVFAMFGRLAWADGLPVAGASVHAAGAWGGTDAQGRFQIEATPGATLDIEGAGSCPLPRRVVATAEGYVALGTILCRRGPTLRVASSAR